MLIERINSFYQFRNAFFALFASNESYQDCFSIEALEALFEYYDQLEEEIEMKPIRICCEWKEKAIDDLIDAYKIDIKDCKNEEDKRETVINFLENKTVILPTSNLDNILYLEF